MRGTRFVGKWLYTEYFFCVDGKTITHFMDEVTESGFIITSNWDNHKLRKWPVQIKRKTDLNIIGDS